MKRCILWLCVSLLCACASPPTIQKGKAKGDGTYKSKFTTVEVLFEKGKLVNIDIDELGATSKDQSKTGSKKELGDDYGLEEVSSINKEWDEQILVLEQYIMDNGVNSIQVDDEGYAKNEDLKTRVTIKIHTYLDVVRMALKDAKLK